MPSLRIQAFTCFGLIPFNLYVTPISVHNPRHSETVLSSLLITHDFKALKKNCTFSYSSIQNICDTKNSTFISISPKNYNIGPKLPFTPFTSKCDKYLLLSKNKFKVCWEDNLKCLLRLIIRNYIALFDSRSDFF
jgi:hypothetical protein